MAREKVNPLVVVDMQPRFWASCHVDTLDGCRRAILRAKKAGSPVVVLEYEFFDVANYRPLRDTHDRLLRALGTYTRKKIAQKRRDDGSSEASAALRDLGVDLSGKITVDFCGVNANACVARTVNSFCDAHHKATASILAEATNDRYWFYTSHDYRPWKRFLDPYRVEGFSPGLRRAGRITFQLPEEATA